MPTPHTGTALSRSHFYSTRFYFYPLHTEDRKAAGAALRAALLDFHRLVKSAQYIKPRDAAPQPPAVN